MSMMNNAEAARLALDEAAQHLRDVIVIYVEPDKNAKPLSFTRRLTLPETDDLQLPFAAGCAKAGALPVLDLHALENASERFTAAVRKIGIDSLPPLTVRISERRPMPIAGVRVIAPSSPRELAGALRYALRSNEICVVAENPLDAYASCDVPDDWDELFGEALTSNDAPNDEPVVEPTPEAADSVSIQIDESAAAIDSMGETAPEAADDARAQDIESDAPVDSIDETMPEAADDAHTQDIESDAPIDSAGETMPEAADDARTQDIESDAPVDSIDETTPEAADDAHTQDIESDAPADSIDETTPETTDSAPDSESLDSTSAPAESPARLVMPAFRSRRYDPAELERTAALLDMPRGALIRLCCQSAETLAEVVIESDAAPGEIACLPPRVKPACLWVGADVLSLCWDPERLNNDAARALLNTASAYLALPARLILDKEK